MSAVAAPVAQPGRTPGRAPGRLRTVLVGGAVVGVLAAVGVAVTSGEEERPGPLFVALPSVPAMPVPPSGTSVAEGPTGRSVPLATDKVREVVPGSGPTAGVRPSGIAGSGSPRPSASAGPVVALPVIGALIGLQPVGEPGRRLRHYWFAARIDPMDATSRERDRADSRFTVRAGRGDATCLSFEAANYPGYFLRSHDFALRLERPGSGFGSDRGYDAEATFCAVPVASGGFVLRSRSAPSRYVTESNSGLSLTEVAAPAAKAFVTRPPL